MALDEWKNKKRTRRVLTHKQTIAFLIINIHVELEHVCSEGVQSRRTCTQMSREKIVEDYYKTFNLSVETKTRTKERTT